MKVRVQTMIRALLFDLGGTLLEEEPRRARECEQMALTSAGLVAGFRGQALRDFVRVLGRHIDSRWQQALREELSSPSDEEIVAEGLALLDGAGETRETQESHGRQAARICQILRWNALCHLAPSPGAPEVLSLLRTRGYRLALASNVLLRPEGVRAHLACLGLSGFFQALVFSSEVGWLQPHPKLFTTALEAVGARAEESVFIGDQLRADIEGAQALGLRAIWKRPPGLPEGHRLPAHQASCVGRLRRQPPAFPGLSSDGSRVVGSPSAGISHLAQGRETAHEPTPDAVISSLEELPAALQRMGGP